MSDWVLEKFLDCLMDWMMCSPPVFGLDEGPCVS